MEALIDLLKTDPNAANTFGALASAAVAFFALLLSIISVGISVWAIHSERKHNTLSVRPLAEITVADYEDCLRVKLRNHGIGPMLITAVSVCDNKSCKPSLVEWMPQLPRDHPWTNFASNTAGRALPPGGEIILLELVEHEGESGFASCRKLIREALATLTVHVEYTDIYNTLMPEHSKPLSWFGRHTA
ncbi:hypothetical protein HA052_16540 [Chromobacterium haemolyticum]|uniref:Uncharacterized protein n=1 Tax=Chromobacterium fluminis TaxID=3044269 RepID=A0ABX0LCW0_9NEIS|nr:hypothetical protein [Chromobacterium haemolyticum]NHR06798.1 hypothetical protein [Chromobacterium haemolyticum]